MNDHEYEVTVVIKANSDRRQDIYASILSALNQCPVIDQVRDLEVRTHA